MSNYLTNNKPLSEDSSGLAGFIIGLFGAFILLISIFMMMTGQIESILIGLGIAGSYWGFVYWFRNKSGFI